MIAAAALEVEDAPGVVVAFIIRSSTDPFVLINFSSRSLVDKREQTLG